MSHDQNFKNLILDYPRESLAFFAAEEAGDGFAGAEITPLRQEQLKERLGERFRELDVPLLVTWGDDRREAIVFVLEEETDTRRFSIHRLAHYCLDIAELCDTDRVVPVVIFLRTGDVPTALDLYGDRHVYLRFRYLSCELAAIAAERYRDSDNIVACLNLPNMAQPPGQRVEFYAAAVSGLERLEPNPDRRLKYLDFIETYAALDDDERTQYQQTHRPETNTMSAYFDRLRQEGRQQAASSIVLRQLQRKFGVLPQEVLSRVEQADPDTLIEWSDRIITADRIDDVVH
jgi:hypothetical protein